jgi:hypothetical protein
MLNVHLLAAGQFPHPTLRGHTDPPVHRSVNRRQGGQTSKIVQFGALRPVRVQRFANPINPGGPDAEFVANLKVGELPHADVDGLFLRPPYGRMGMQEESVLRLVCASSLGRDDEVDRRINRRDSSCDQIAVRVADDREPVACAEAIERGRNLGGGSILLKTDSSISSP